MSRRILLNREAYGFVKVILPKKIVKNKNQNYTNFFSKTLIVVALKEKSKIEDWTRWKWDLGSSKVHMPIYWTTNVFDLFLSLLESINPLTFFIGPAPQPQATNSHSSKSLDFNLTIWMNSALSFSTFTSSSICPIFLNYINN